MNSQNRMNAGAEYVVYRIWAALQDERGIHAESLLACLGALAGYACQTYVRQTAALPGADPTKYALMAVDASDGTTYVYGDSLNASLVESPLSVWALVSRELQKLGEPLPDLAGIQTYVTETIGTGAFGMPRVPSGHHPRFAPIVYLERVWPQILPIAQRFCRKPAQLPTLFGIALQRAIEETRDALNPTLGASIAMECAVAMSKVVLPEGYSNPVAVSPSVPVAPEVIAAPKPTVSAARGASTDSMVMRATPARKRKRVDDADESASGIVARLAHIPPAARLVTIAALAFVAIAGAMYETDGDGEEIVQGTAAPEVRKLATSPTLPEEAPAVDTPVVDAPVLASAVPEAQAPQEQPPLETVAATAATAGEPVEALSSNNPLPEADQTNEVNEFFEGMQPRFEPSSDGSAEIVIPNDSVGG